MPIKWMALECIHYRKFTHQSDVWSYGGCWMYYAKTSLCLMLIPVGGIKSMSWIPVSFICISTPLSVCLLVPSLFVSPSRFLFVSPSPTWFRSDHLGADDIRRQTIWRHPHKRNPRHPGERGAPVSAAHLHHRRLHGHGQMWENKHLDMLRLHRHFWTSCNCCLSRKWQHWTQSHSNSVSEHISIF